LFFFCFFFFFFFFFFSRELGSERLHPRGPRPARADPPPDQRRSTSLPRLPSRRSDLQPGHRRRHPAKCSVRTARTRPSEVSRPRRTRQRPRLRIRRRSGSGHEIRNAAPRDNRQPQRRHTAG
jgi:hypothetical protein